MKNNIIISLLLLLSFSIFSQTNENPFEKATQYYDQGEYQNAIDQDKSIL